MKRTGFFFAVLLSMSLLVAQSGFSGSESLVLYLPFDEGTGDTTRDLSGKGNDGTIHGAKWVDGKINKALEFGGGSFVEIPHSDSLSPDVDITVMAWVFMNKGASGEMAIVSKGQWAANDLPYELTITSGGVIFWQFYDNGGRDSCAPSSPSAGEWHHIAGTYDGDVFKCYIDGEMGMEFAYKGKLPKNTASVTIGKRSKAEECFFNGSIDEVAIFNTALSINEIKEAMKGIKVAAVCSRGKLPTMWGEIKAGD